jgi:hypothetical protein
MTRSIALAFASLLLASTGCSKKKDAPVEKTAETPASTGEAPTSAPAPAPKGGDSPGGPCERPWTPAVADVLEASEHKVTIARREGSVTICQFTSSEPVNVLMIRIEEGASPAAFEEAKKGSGGQPVADVSGLGDKAYRYSLGKVSHNVVAMKGRSMVSLSLAGGEMAPLLELAAKVVAASP